MLIIISFISCWVFFFVLEYSNIFTIVWNYCLLYVQLHNYVIYIKVICNAIEFWLISKRPKLSIPKWTAKEHCLFWGFILMCVIMQEPVFYSFSIMQVFHVHILTLNRAFKYEAYWIVGNCLHIMHSKQECKINILGQKMWRILQISIA